MPIARIFRPDKNAMQSGKAGMQQWLLVFEQETPYFVDDLMGWSGMKDTLREIRLRFPTREAAIAYASANNLPYQVVEPKPRQQVRKAYADNFKYSKTA